eukprot:TRINITY_DN6552_c0_g1_i4.p1 TRINITY_DN6552_c0_g1~~TRINITY_DN6552_c0_g1_i4.p1  ORF type:complete len:526 (+),score=128.19 TRINITY_DN6552_c0_g1_i4:273-1850(+)
MQSQFYCSKKITEEEKSFVIQEIGAGEKVALIAKVIKFNYKSKMQERFLVLTNKSIYNMAPKDFISGMLSFLGIRPTTRRRISLNKINEITVSKYSGEFIIHVPEEYDYRYSSNNEREIIIMTLYEEIMKRFPTKRLGFFLKSYMTLENFTTTKYDKRDGYNRRPTEPPQFFDASGLKNHLETVREHRSRMSMNTKTLVNKQGEQEVTLEDFVMAKVIGRGSQGKVFLARKKGDQELLAIKAVAKGEIRKNGDISSVKTERYILEKADHPFLVQLEYAFHNSTTLFYVMKYMRGGELFKYLEKAKRFPEARAKFYAAEILMAIEFLHSMDIVYRDLKPENILMDVDGHIKLSDYGLSKYVGCNRVGMTMVGTWDYLPPEVITQTGHGKTADWWSFGILIFEMLYGRPPFYNPNKDTTFELIQRAGVKFPDRGDYGVSDTAKDLILKLLHKDPGMRLGSHADGKEIKSHPWFAGMNWEKLYHKEIAPPFVPTEKEMDAVEGIDPRCNEESNFVLQVYICSLNIFVS